MNGLGLILIACVGCMVLCGSRRIAMLGFIATICYIPLNQQVVFGGLHFTSMRTVLLLAFVRVFMRGEYKGLERTSIDRAVLAFAVALATIACLRVHTMSEVVDRAGVTYDIILSYFVTRCLVSTYDEIKAVFSVVTVLIVPFALLMAKEAFTGSNPFQILGIEEGDEFRHGIARSRGSFQHSITAGVFGATLMPIFIGLAYKKWFRMGLLIGVAAAGLITFSSSSSGPLMAFIIGSLAMAGWRFRERMKTFRWGIVFALIGLEIVMKAHVWFVIGRMSAIAGGDAEYRAELIDAAIRNFGQWWFMGFHDTGEWMPNSLADGTADITNQYIRVGVDGGLLTLILFVTILVRCFRQLGLARKAARYGQSEDHEAREWFLWCLGCALAAHVVTVMTVEYYDQMRNAWYILFAVISGMTCDTLNTEAELEALQEHDGENMVELQSADEEQAPFRAPGDFVSG